MSWWRKALGFEHDAGTPRSRRINTGTLDGRELDEMIASHLGVTRAEAQEARKTVFAVIAHAIDEGHVVRVPRFGQFYLTRILAHRQDAFGKVVDVPTRDHPRFRPFQSFTDEIAATPPEEG